MFRALDMFRKESEEGFQSPSHSEFVVQQQNLFTKQLANSYPTFLPVGANTNPADVLKTAVKDLAAYDPNTRQATMSRDIDLASYATSVEVNKELIDANQRCATTPLDILMGTENPNKKVRCGWIYQKGTDTGAQPAVSQGALGSRSGPMSFFENPRGTWFWSLEDAQKAILTDRCGALTNCKDAGSPQYANCAYSTSRGIGVPVDTTGNLLYPRDDRLNAPIKSLIREGSKCPPPPPPGSPAYDLLRSRDVCTPLPNGQLSRDCMLQQIQVAGCKRDGSLYQALLNEAQPNNYAAGLTPLLAYKKYQELATPPGLMDAAVRDGKVTKELALQTFQGLAKESGKVQQTPLNFAARDLCLKAGTIDRFDFCTELKDSSPAPFDLDCLQKAFRKAGGQPAGSDYPRNDYPNYKIRNFWNSLGTWKAVNEQIQTYVAGIQSKDEKTQRSALKAFLGIEREPYAPNQIAKIVGIESFWFDASKNAYIGRRVSGPTNAEFPTIKTYDTNISNTGLTEYIEYYVITNLRPPENTSIQLQITTDDGMLLGNNVAVDGQTTKGRGFNDTQRFGANWGQPPTTYTQNTCWTLRKNGPNYITGYWQQGPAIKYSEILYKPCNTNAAYTKIPTNWVTLTQELDAPMLSWQFVPKTGTFDERRMPSQFPVAMTEVTTAQKEGMPKDLVGVARFEKRTSFLAGTKNIATNSWRTLTLGFFTGTDNKGRRDGFKLLTFGPLEIFIDNANVSFKWSSATLSAFKKFENVLDTSNKKMNYIYVNMKSEFDNMFPNRLTFSVGPATKFTNGTITVDAVGDNTESYTTENNNPLYNRGDSDLFLIGSAQNAAKIDLAFLRLFDYEMTTDDCIKDVNNEWQWTWIE